MLLQIDDMGQTDQSKLTSINRTLPRGKAERPVMYRALANAVEHAPILSSMCKFKFTFWLQMVYIFTVTHADISIIKPRPKVRFYTEEL